jgi:hypothetical protein
MKLDSIKLDWVCREAEFFTGVSFSPQRSRVQILVKAIREVKSVTSKPTISELSAYFTTAQRDLNFRMDTTSRCGAQLRI